MPTPSPSPTDASEARDEIHTYDDRILRVGDVVRPSFRSYLPPYARGVICGFVDAKLVRVQWDTDKDGENYLQPVEYIDLAYVGASHE